MNTFIILIGIILILLMILLSFDKNKHLQEAFGTLPIVDQSSYLSSDIPGAVTTNPTIAKPTIKEIVDARDTVKTFLGLCLNVGNQISVTEKQSYITLKYNAPIFMNQIDALESNPEIVKTDDFYKTWNKYKQAIQKIKQLPTIEGFTNAVTEASVKQDIANLLDAISIFEESYASKDISKINLTSDRNFINDLHISAQSTSRNVMGTTPRADNVFAARIQMLTGDYQRGFVILSSLPDKITSSASGSTSASTSESGSATSDKISLQGVKDLIANIQVEQLRLQNLRSTDITVSTRIRLLDQLLADLREIVRKVENNEIKSEEIPIKASDASAFLAQYKNSDNLPYLMEQTGTTDTSLESSTNIFSKEHNIKSGTEVTQISNMGNSMIPTEVLQYLKNLKWSMEIKIHNDPGISYRERTMNRIKELEQRIAAYAYNDIPIPPALQNAFKMELKALSEAITSDYSDSYEEHEEYDDYDRNYSLSKDEYYGRFDSEHTRMPQDERTNTWSLQDYNPFNKKDNSNSDAMRRPGFIMNDDTIARRGSASAFDDSVIGGLDYKQRAKELCRQIKSAQLGNPATFGCIENQDAVSSTYSWKGNVEMICNRLGDTWGGWYPEMFGCPKYDPTKKYDGAEFQ